MGKKFFLAAILLVVLTQTGLAQQNATSVEILTTYKLEITETKIWVVNQNDITLQSGGKAVALCLEETNPNFFALVCNAIKDHLREKKTHCYIWTTPVNSNINGNYAKITQVQFN